MPSILAACFGDNCGLRTLELENQELDSCFHWNDGAETTSLAEMTFVVGGAHPTKTDEYGVRYMPEDQNLDAGSSPA